MVTTVPSSSVDVEIAGDQQADVECRWRVGQGADRDGVHTGGGDVCDGVERDGAGGLELRSGTGGVAPLDDQSHLLDRHVVQQDPLDLAVQRFAGFLRGGDLDLDRHTSAFGGHAVTDPAYGRE